MKLEQIITLEIWAVQATEDKKVAWDGGIVHVKAGDWLTVNSFGVIDSMTTAEIEAFQPASLTPEDAEKEKKLMDTLKYAGY